MKMRYKVALAAAVVGIVGAVGITAASADEPVPLNYAIVLQNTALRDCVDLDIASPRTDSPPAQPWGCHYGANQALFSEQQYIPSLDRTATLFVSVHDRSKCLTADASTPAGNGQRLTFQQCTGDLSQSWGTVPIDRGWYNYVAWTNLGASIATGRTMVLDQSWDYTTLHLWEFLGNDNQAWMTYGANFTTDHCTSTPQCTFQGIVAGADRGFDD